MTNIQTALEALDLANGGTACLADFHMHSCVSDGSCSADELVKQAEDAGLSHIAITNHDTTQGILDAQNAAAGSSVNVIGAIEISAFDFSSNRKVHVVGLNMPENAPAINELCQPTLQARCKNSEWQIDRLLEADYHVDLDAVSQLSARSTCLYKQHIMAGLTDAPYKSPEYRSLYVSLFKGNGICARDIEYVDARDAVRAIVESEGVPVLAHPGQMDNWDFVPALVDCGLAGIEVFHPDHAKADEKRALQLAQDYGLFISGGSDYHGSFGTPPRIGFRTIR